MEAVFFIFNLDEAPRFELLKNQKKYIIGKKSVIPNKTFA